MRYDYNINMNGRAYDSVLGRMLSPDPITQDPLNTQSYNKFCSAFNNPLKYTDSTGYVSHDVNGGGREAIDKETAPPKETKLEVGVLKDGVKDGKTQFQIESIESIRVLEMPVFTPDGTPVGITQSQAENLTNYGRGEQQDDGVY